MARPRRLAGQVEAAHQPRHAGFAICHAKAVADDPAQVDQPPGGNTIHFRLGASQHDGLERGLLAIGKPAGAPRSPVIRQAIGAGAV
jgi:hypothetical protein